MKKTASLRWLLTPLATKGYGLSEQVLVYQEERLKSGLCWYPMVLLHVDSFLDRERGIMNEIHGQLSNGDEIEVDVCVSLVEGGRE